MASRVSGGKVLNAIAKRVPWLIGGSADLAPSTMTLLTFPEAGGDFDARQLRAAATCTSASASTAWPPRCNGMALSHLRPYGATFFVFYDYCKPSVRLAALMQLNPIFVFTHDSIGLGEDGPTHQPIEHLAAARAMPNLITLRPGDANEVAEAWRAIMPIKDRPVALVLTRQNLPTLDRTKYAPAAGVAKGAYVLADAEGGKPQVILMATGSELSLAVEAYEKLKAEGVKARVVSMPSWELFEEQDEAYRNSVLAAGRDRTAWRSRPRQSLAGSAISACAGKFRRHDRLRRSAPASALYKHFGITADAVVAAAKEVIAGK